MTRHVVRGSILVIVEGEESGLENMKYEDA